MNCYLQSLISMTTKCIVTGKWLVAKSETRIVIGVYGHSQKIYVMLIFRNPSKNIFVTFD